MPGYHFNRRIRTTAKKRLNQPGVEEVPARAKRSLRMLPDTWDDFVRRCERCWKSFRKTRWK